MFKFDVYVLIQNQSNLFGCLRLIYRGESSCLGDIITIMVYTIINITTNDFNHLKIKN